MTIKVESTSIPEVAPTVAPVVEAQAKEEKSDESATAEAVENTEASDATEKEPLESDEPSDDEGEDEETESKEEKPKKKNGFKKRIDKLSKRASLAEEERDYWREQAMKGKATQEKEPAEAKKETVSAEGKPNADDYASHEEWIEAVTDWKIEQREKAAEAKKRENEVKSEFQKKAENYAEAEKKLAKEVDDYEDVIAAVDDVPLSFTLQQLLLKAGPELAYQLAKNPKEYERINALPPIEMAAEFGEFKALVKSSKAKEEKKEIKTTKAPAPINPVGGKGSFVNSKNIFDPNLTQAEYEELRAQQRKKGA